MIATATAARAAGLVSIDQFLGVLHLAQQDFTITELRHTLGLSRAGGSNLAAALVREGLADRYRDPDGRVVNLSITPAGRRLARG